jgi:hypothetical protein
MAWNKLSVFHWHIIEIDSFPLELDSFPQLAQNAAFARNQVYTKAQVADIVRIHSCCTVLYTVQSVLYSHAAGSCPFKRSRLRACAHSSSLFLFR